MLMLKIIGHNASNCVKTLGLHLHALLYSTSILNNSTTTTTISPVFVNYLISLGFSRRRADPMSTKLAHTWHNKKRSNHPNNYSYDSSSDWARIWRNRGAKTVSDFNFIANANSVISFLENSGFKEAHIRELVLYDPKILVFKVTPTLKPKVQAFLNQGLSVTDFAQLVRKCPSVLSAGFNSAIVPSLRFLREVLGIMT